MYVCKDSAAPAHARTRADRPAAPRQKSSDVSQTPLSLSLSVQVVRGVFLGVCQVVSGSERAGQVANNWRCSLPLL